VERLKSYIFKKSLFTRGLIGAVFLLTLVGALLSCDDQGRRFSFGQTRSDAFNSSVEKTIQELFQKYVTNESLVRYAKWLQNGDDLSLLDSVVKAIAENDDSSFTVDQKKAFYINAYNVLTVDLILDHFDETLGTSSSPFPQVRSIQNISNLGPEVWNHFYWTVSGKRMNLNDIEHKILRPFGDARIHFAIVCASKGCPPLQAEVFTSDTINSDLDKLSKRFVNSGKDTIFDKEHKRINTSQILNWFEDDFKNHFGSLMKFFRQYVEVLNPEELSDYSIHFIDYDWVLNEAPSGSGTETL